ncbi:MAG: radical SAM protein, partial [Verrucomicrobiota bacterium]
MGMVNQLIEKAASGERLNPEEGLTLFKGASLHQLGQLADQLRQKKVGNRASYVVNRYLNYSNICILNCQFCAFAKKKRDEDAFEYSIDEMVSVAKDSIDNGITEIHIVGGLHPTLPFDYYLDIIRSLKAVHSRLMLKAFTAVEIRHLALRVAKL